MVKLASYKNGIGYGKWTHIDGWSESVVEYIRALEETQWVNAWAKPKGQLLPFCSHTTP